MIFADCFPAALAAPLHRQPEAPAQPKRSPAKLRRKPKFTKIVDEKEKDDLHHLREQNYPGYIKAISTRAKAAEVNSNFSFWIENIFPDYTYLSAARKRYQAKLAADKGLVATPDLTSNSSVESASTATLAEVLTYGVNYVRATNVHVHKAEDDHHWTAGPVSNGTSHVIRSFATADVHADKILLKEKKDDELAFQTNGGLLARKEVPTTGGALKRRNTVVKRASNLCNFTYNPVQLNLSERAW